MWIFDSGGRFVDFGFWSLVADLDFIVLYYIYTILLYTVVADSEFCTLVSDYGFLTLAANFGFWTVGSEFGIWTLVADKC